MGAVTVGYKMNNRFAQTLHSLSGEDVLFVTNGAVTASSFADAISYPSPQTGDGTLRQINGIAYDLGIVPLGEDLKNAFSIVLLSSAITCGMTAT